MWSVELSAKILIIQQFHVTYLSLNRITDFFSPSVECLHQSGEESHVIRSYLIQRLPIFEGFLPLYGLH